MNKNMKIFIWHDLAGGQRCGLMTEEQLRKWDTDEGVAPPMYNYEIPIVEWAEECTQGQEWYNATDSFECVGTIEDFEILILRESAKTAPQTFHPHK